jgi:hypothetical protein
VLGTDFLEILSFSPLGNGYLALSFLAAPSRTYALPNSTHLVSGHWSAAGFAMTTNEPPARTFYTSEEDAYTTLYLQPTNNAAVRLEVK